MTANQAKEFLKLQKHQPYRRQKFLITLTLRKY